MLSINTTLQAAIDLLPDAVIVVNQEIKIVAANSQVLEVFGYRPEELLFKNLNILLPERYRKIHDQYFRQYFQSPAKRRMGTGSELFGLSKDGEELDLDIALAPINVSDQDMVMATIRDVSDLRALDRNLLKQNEELSLANTRLERLGYVIAHDLKSPLLNVHAILNLLKRELEGESSKKIEGYLKVLSEISRSMMNLITGVADYSKTGFQNAAEEAVDLQQVLREVRSLLHFPDHFHLNVKEQLPVIQGNKTKVLQIFLNLVNNAIKYNDKPEGVIEICAYVKGKICTIHVADNGPGVPPELRNSVFELFRKGPVEKEGSQGIGLAVVKKIIEDRGGQIAIEDSPMGGADFVFTWPLEEIKPNVQK